MRVIVRADATPLIGGGHVMRCLTLSNALSARGAKVAFVTAAMPETLRDRIVASGHELVERPLLPDLDRAGANWHEPPLDGDAQLDDATAAEAGSGPADWVIVDHYLLDARWHSAARRFASKILAIDDLANRQYDCDILLDQSLGRQVSDYSGLTPSGAEVLAGARYSLLRPEFVRERGEALARRKKSGPVERILISMGTSDPGEISARVVDIVLAAAPDCAIDVVLGPQAASLGLVNAIADKHPHVAVHVNSRDMAGLMRDADLAIGAAGGTSYERCCLGLPSIAIVLAENQRAGAEALDAAGAAIVVHSAEAIGPALEALLSNNDLRSRMSAACFAIADGRGTEHVIAAMLGERHQRDGQIELRSASMDDAETLWLWRNDPETRRQSRTTEPVLWADHVRWLGFTLDDPARRLCVADIGDVAVGMVRFDPAPGGADEISINVAPDQRTRGIGSAILRAALAQVPSQRILARVNEKNASSRRLFESCGFALIDGAEAGFLLYVLDVPQRRRKRA